MPNLPGMVALSNPESGCLLAGSILVAMSGQIIMLCYIMLQMYYVLHFLMVVP